MPTQRPSGLLILFLRALPRSRVRWPYLTWLLSRSYTSPRSKCRSGEEVYVKAFAAAHSLDSHRRHRRLYRRHMERSSTDFRSTAQLHDAAADCRESSELQSRLGSGSRRHVRGYDRWRLALEIRGRAGSRKPAIPRCARRERPCGLSHVHREQHRRFSHLQDERRRRALEHSVSEHDSERLLRLLLLLDAEPWHNA